jgi:hypothetical protein
MKFKIMLLFLLVAISAIFTKCYYDSIEYLHPELSVNCDTSVYTYKDTVRSILQYYCNECHSNANAASMGKNVKLEDSTDVVKEVGFGLMHAIKHDDPKFIPMPYQRPALSSCNIAIIQKWVDKLPKN